MSLGPTLLGESAMFLGHEDIECLATQAGLVDLISIGMLYGARFRSRFRDVQLGLIYLWRDARINVSNQ